VTEPLTVARSIDSLPQPDEKTEAASAKAIAWQAVEQESRRANLNRGMEDLWYGGRPIDRLPFPLRRAS
jgi:hypothetical protein